MICLVYKTKKRANTYLYVPQSKGFEDVPDDLQQIFTGAELVLTVNLQKPRKLARMSSVEMMTHLQTYGYFLQMPPKEPDLLEQHQLQQGKTL